MMISTGYERMSFAVYIAFAGWAAVSIVLFAVLHPRRALLASLIGGFLLLPVAGFPVTGLRAKISIISIVLLPLSVAFEPDRFLRLRPRLYDLPAAIWCAWPAVSSLANGLGSHDAFSAALENLLGFGIPYLLGRAYFGDLHGLRELGVAIFLGGLAYVPLCLWEIRFTPQLHRIVYGFHQHFFGMTIRLGGYRPMVFMDHGLMVGLWMTAATVVGYWLWRSGSLRHVYGVPVGLLLTALFVTTILCKSTGALALLAVGLLARSLLFKFRSAAPLVVLVLVTPAYLAARIGRVLPTEPIIAASEQISGSARSESLSYRIWNEELLLTRALEKRSTGWGRWGRFLVFDPETHVRLSTPDGLWIIALGQYGFVGLAALTAMLLLPSLLFVRRYPLATWNMPLVAPAAALALFVPLYMIDNLLNAMINPVYFVAAGALTGLRWRRLARPLAKPRLPMGPRPMPVRVRLAGLHGHS
jgi:hypothetical protein